MTSPETKKPSQGGHKNNLRSPTHAPKSADQINIKRLYNITPKKKPSLFIEFG